MSRVYDNSYLGAGVANGIIASMSYNIGPYDNVAYQIHAISRNQPSPQFLLSAPNAIWKVFDLSGTPIIGFSILTQNILPGPQEKQAEIDASLPTGPTIGTIKLQQSNDNIFFADVPDFASNMTDNGDLLYTVTNPLAQWHRLLMTLNPGDINFTVRVCARINTPQSD